MKDGRIIKIQLCAFFTVALNERDTSRALERACDEASSDGYYLIKLDKRIRATTALQF